MKVRHQFLDLKVQLKFVINYNPFIGLVIQFVNRVELQAECLITSPTSWERRPRDWIAVRLYDRTTIRVSDYKSNFLGATTTRLDRLITLGSPSG